MATTTTRPRPARRRPPAAPAEAMLGPVSPDLAPGDGVPPPDAAAKADQLRQQLDNLCKALAETRKEAIDGRKSSGIETIWIEDDEHYEGIDDLNRDKTTTTTQTKPPGQRAPVTAENQATEFPNITRPYVDAAAAKVGDIIVPTDDKGWSIKAPPIPELAQKAKGGLSPEVIQGMAQHNVPEATAVEVAKTEQASAQAMLEEADEKAKRAEDRIEDWHIEGQFHGELRKVIDTAARMGTGVLKGPVPMKKRQQMFVDNALVIQDEVKPVSREVDPWNCFPDPACGSSIHNGRYHWERDYLTPKQLMALKGTDYLDDQIDACVEEGPKTTNEPAAKQQADGRYLDTKGLFEVWYYYGHATREDMEAAGCPCQGDGPLLVPAIFTMVNDRVIKAAFNPLDTGEFPYDYFPWQRRRNMPWGTGIARQIRTAQRIVTAGTRVMLTNAGRAAGPIFLMRRGVVGADGRNDIVPWKSFYAPETDATDDVRKLMEMYEIPDRQQSLAAIIQYGLKIAEDTTGLPLLLQGQNGSAPDTLGGQLLVDRNASGVLRRIARTFDDCITEPHVHRYYTYLLINGDDDLEKGEFVIDARGSTALVEREINREEAAAILKLSLDPRFGVDPKKAMFEKLRADKRNPQDFLYSEEDQKKIDQQQQQPSDPRVQVATITTQSKEKIEAAHIQADAAEGEKDRQRDLIVQEMLEHVEEMKLTGAKEISFEDLKAQLAGIAMKLRTQDNLSARDAALALHKHHIPGAEAMAPVVAPPTEPAGRAPNGQAFEA